MNIFEGITKEKFIKEFNKKEWLYVVTPHYFFKFAK